MVGGESAIASAADLADSLAVALRGLPKVRKALLDIAGEFLFFILSRMSEDSTFFNAIIN